MFRCTKLCRTGASQRASQPASRSVGRPDDRTDRHTDGERHRRFERWRRGGRTRNSTPALAAPPTTLSLSPTTTFSFSFSLSASLSLCLSFSLWSSAENVRRSRLTRQIRHVLLSRILTFAGNAISRRFYRKKKTATFFLLFFEHLNFVYYV